jgi:hypothetical protein
MCSNIPASPAYGVYISQLIRYARTSSNRNLDRNSLEKLYFGFIRPILEYGSVVWDNCTREQSDLIESVQYEDLLQASLKKWWVESDFKAPNLPLSLRFKGSGCHCNSI